MLAILICFSILLVFTILTGNSLGLLSQSNLFNYFFLVLMTLIILPLTMRLKRNADSISYNLNDAEKNVNSWKTYTFSNSNLQSLYKSFLNQESATEKAVNNYGKEYGAVDCDISDYINMSVLNSMINKPVCDIVAATLTGLGLLGTFVGLIWGLNGFNTDYDNMQTSIANLLNGIRTAFMTSIYGVVFSLVFNWIYKNKYSRMKAELDNYHKAFYRFAQNSAEYNTNSRLIDTLSGLSSSITRNFDSSMSNMTGVLKSSLAVQEKSLTTSISAMTSAVESSITSMEKAVEVALKNQESSLKTMVETYVNESDKKRKQELKEFKDSLEKISKSNNNYCDKVSELTLKVEGSTEKFTDTVGEFDSYMNSISEYQGKITDANQHLENNMKALTVRYDEHNEETRTLSGNVKSLDETVEKMISLTTALNNLVEASENSRIAFAENADKLIDKINESANEVNENALRASGICSEVANEISRHSEVNMKESIDTLRELSAEFKSTSENLGRDYRNLSEDLQRGIEKSFNEFDGDTADVIRKFTSILEDIRDTADYIPEKLNETVSHEFEKQRRNYEKLRTAYIEENVTSDNSDSDSTEDFDYEVNFDDDIEQETEVLYDEDI